MPLKCEPLLRPVGTKCPLSLIHQVVGQKNSSNMFTYRSELTVTVAERRGDRKIEALTASMFPGDLMSRGTPVLRFVVLAVCLNIVIHETIDFRSGTGPNGATLKLFRKTRWFAITEHPFEK